MTLTLNRPCVTKQFKSNVPHAIHLMTEAFLFLMGIVSDCPFRQKKKKNPPSLAHLAAFIQSNVQLKPDTSERKTVNFLHKDPIRGSVMVLGFYLTTFWSVAQSLSEKGSKCKKRLLCIMRCPSLSWNSPIKKLLLHGPSAMEMMRVRSLKHLYCNLHKHSKTII